MFQPATELRRDEAMLAGDGQREERKSASSLRKLLFLLLQGTRQACHVCMYVFIYIYMAVFSA